MIERADGSVIQTVFPTTDDTVLIQAVQIAKDAFQVFILCSPNSNTYGALNKYIILLSTRFNWKTFYLFEIVVFEFNVLIVTSSCGISVYAHRLDSLLI